VKCRQCFSRHRSTLLIGLAFAGAAALAAIYLARLPRAEGAPIPPLDDTYIHLQYAKLLAHGHGFAYVPGEGYTTGATSPLYVAVLAALFRLGLGDALMTWVALILGAAALGATALAAGLVARRLARSPLTPFVAAAAVLASGPLVWNSLSGMETGVFAAALMGTLALALADDGPAPRRRLVAALALLPLVRPDGAVFAAVIGGARLLRSRPAYRTALLRLLPAAAPFFLYLLANRLLTGDAATAGMRLKSYTHDVYASPVHALLQIVDACWRRLGIVFGGANQPPQMPALLAPLAILGAFTPAGEAAGAGGSAGRWAQRALLGVLILVGYVALNNTRGNLHGWQRYFVPLYPLYLTAAALGLDRLAAWLPEAARVPAVVVGAAALAAWVAADTHPAWLRYYASEAGEIAAKQVPIARAIRDRLPPGESVVTMDVGAVAFIGGHPTFDIIGLTTRGIVPYALLEVPGRVEALGAIPAARRPRFAALYGSSLPAPLVGRVLDRQRNFQLYEIDWRPLDAADVPEDAGEVVDRLDVADPASEAAHGYRFAPRDLGVGRRAVALVYPVRGQPAADSGRPVDEEQFVLSATPDKPATLILRTEANPPPVEVRWNDGAPLPLAPLHAGGWTELAGSLPAPGVQARNRVVVRSTGRHRSYHWFLRQ
jgi:hypothetical protein